MANEVELHGPIQRGSGVQGQYVCALVMAHCPGLLPIIASRRPMNLSVNLPAVKGLQFVARPRLRLLLHNSNHLQPAVSFLYEN